MKVKFYGTRGSVPVCDKDYQEYGGNTSCILIQNSNGLGVLDAGTGIRQLGKDLIECKDDICKQFYLAFSHFHWDHIQGFPFFLPAYLSDRKIIISAIGKDATRQNLQGILGGQMKHEYFPIPLEQMGAELEFLNVTSDEYRTSNFHVKTTPHNHPGGAYTYRIEAEGKSVVYCTDVEHIDGIDERVVRIAKDTDLLIHDAQYTPEELEYKKGWGHSSHEQAIEVAKLARVKKLVLTHHDPDHNDSFLCEMENRCKDMYEDVCLAKEGITIEI